jgi:hypothetical protein
VSFISAVSNHCTLSLPSYLLAVKPHPMNWTTRRPSHVAMKRGSFLSETLIPALFGIIMASEVTSLYATIHFSSAAIITP